MDVRALNKEATICFVTHKVNLRWFRGASRYNNGGITHKNAFPIRRILNRLKIE